MHTKRGSRNGVLQRLERRSLGHGSPPARGRGDGCAKPLLGEGQGEFCGGDGPLGTAAGDGLLVGGLTRSVLGTFARVQRLVERLAVVALADGVV